MLRYLNIFGKNNWNVYIRISTGNLGKPLLFRLGKKPTSMLWSTSGPGPETDLRPRPVVLLRPRPARLRNRWLLAAVSQADVTTNCVSATWTGPVVVFWTRTAGFISVLTLFGASEWPTPVVSCPAYCMLPGKRIVRSWAKALCYYARMITHKENNLKIVKIQNLIERVARSPLLSAIIFQKYFEFSSVCSSKMNTEFGKIEKRQTRHSI